MFIEYQSKFWIKNICEFNSEELKLKITAPNSNLIIDGLKHFPQLLKEIYSDYEIYEASDYAESYHNLMNTIKLLYAIGQSGSLIDKDNIHYLQTNKENFKKFFKASPEYHINALIKYGFNFEYYKNSALSDTYKECDSFTIYYSKENSLLIAIKYLIEQMPNADYKEVYARNFTMFSIADYNSIILKQSILREDINPLCKGIINVTDGNQLWTNLVNVLCVQNNLSSSVNLWSEIYGEYRPVWDLKFKKGKKKVCSIHINIGYIGVDLMLTPNQARDSYNEQLPESLRNSINYFINNQIKGQPRATTVSFVLASKQEIDAVGIILKNILKS